mmetsp:Transcript_49010/g.131553  ORF Transcript_49010/g.131553 Transcript_49010/m.131553 type:complete len:110 (+) Transcript_49010:134-463(+)
MCESAGSGFTCDTNKAARCPELKPKNYTDWSCDDWKCHMYCTNPINKVARKACGNCEEPTVSSVCFEDQKRACATQIGAGCDADCSSAIEQWRPSMLVLSAVGVRLFLI